MRIAFSLSKKAMRIVYAILDESDNRLRENVRCAYC